MNSVESRVKQFDFGGLSVLHTIPLRPVCPYPIIFLHGMWCTGEFFRETMERLSFLGYECLAPSYRGHGKSCAVPDIGKLSIEDYIDDIRSLIESRRRPVIPVGHSTGVIISAELASRMPDRVIGHIGITSAPPRWVLMSLKMIVRLPKYLGSILRFKPFCLDNKDMSKLLFNRNSPSEVEKLLPLLCLESGKVAWEITRWKYRLKKLSCPSLLIGAKYDKLTPHQRGIARRLGAKFVQVPCSHMVMHDPNRDLVIFEIHNWLKQQFAKPQYA